MTLKTIETAPLITLVGSPNSGKTTLFNYLSGRNYKTVNYPGATVEYSISGLSKRFNINANVIDSPGIISLYPNSPDEKVSIDALFNHPDFGTPDLIIVTVDASQLSRHLLLVKQLKDLKLNVVIALTMTDLLAKKNLSVSLPKLSEILNCSVVEIDGRTGKGVNELIKIIVKDLEVTTGSDHKKTIVNQNGKYRDDLIAIFKEIEKIEKEVIYEFHSNGDNLDLLTANNQLRILTDPLIKQNCYKVDHTTIKIDKVLLHKVWGLIAFFLIMAFTFTSIFWLAEPLMTMIDGLFGFMSSTTFSLLGNNWYSDLLATGIIGGTGSVLIFLPQILILFVILGILEDTGYLARGAMLIDKPLSKIGLNGKSFVPMLSGFACAIPAMMAARTIPNRRERLLTIFILPLMSCSARLPVYTLLIAFLFPGDKAWIGGLALASIYIFGISSSIVIAGLLNKIKNKLIKVEDNSSFILELPAYRKPKLSFILVHSYDNAKLYLKKAGPIILLFSIVLWFLTYFPNTNPNVETFNKSQEEIVQMQKAERLSNSYASELGKLIQPFMSPLGMDWRVGVSLISAFAAREVFVSSLALIFKVTNDGETLQKSMLESMRKAEIDGSGKKLFTTATSIGLIVFFMFALQCLSTVAVSRKETGSWRIPLLQIILFTGIAYLFTFITVNGLRALGIQ
jgi:ferrous iron transport protein B